MQKLRISYFEKNLINQVKHSQTLKFYYLPVDIFEVNESI